MATNSKLNAEETAHLLQKLKSRFEEHTSRHQKIKWEKVEKKLSANPKKLWSLSRVGKGEFHP